MLDRKVLFQEKIDVLLKEKEDNVKEDARIKKKQNEFAIDQKKAERKVINSSQKKAYNKMIQMVT